MASTVNRPAAHARSASMTTQHVEKPYTAAPVTTIEHVSNREARKMDRRLLWTDGLTGPTVRKILYAADNRIEFLKLVGMPQTTGPISPASRPKFTTLCGHLEKILLLNKFFPIVDTCPTCEDIA